MARGKIKTRKGGGPQVGLHIDNKPPLGHHVSAESIPEGGQDGEKHMGKPKGQTKGSKIVTHGKGA